MDLQVTLGTTAVLLFGALPGAILAGGALFVPWSRTYWSWPHARAMLRRHGWALGGLVAMLVPESLESMVDPTVTRWLQVDFTGVFARVEGGFHAGLQSALAPVQPVLQPLLTVTYVAGYPFLIIFTAVLGVWLGNGVLARRALGAYVLCFAFALPFYLLVPVQEVWYYVDPANGGAVHNLAIQYTWVREHIYAYNEVNNCFPSLHTALSVALAAVAWRSGAPRRYARAAAILSGGIVLSTLYLGIHWVADVLAGFALAAVVVVIVERIWPASRHAGPTAATPAAPAGAETGGPPSDKAHL